MCSSNMTFFFLPCHVMILSGGKYSMKCRVSPWERSSELKSENAHLYLSTSPNRKTQPLHSNPVLLHNLVNSGAKVKAKGDK